MGRTQGIVRAMELAGQIPLDALGHLVEGVRKGTPPHPLLLACREFQQYEALAELVELMASMHPEEREEVLNEVYVHMRLLHTGEKL
jgi:hypothetical protein